MCLITKLNGPAGTISLSFRYNVRGFRKKKLVKYLALEATKSKKHKGQSQGHGPWYHLKGNYFRVHTCKPLMTEKR